MSSPKQTKHSRPNDAFLRKYGYVIKRSKDNPNVGVVYDRNGNRVKPADYQRSVDAWNKSQQTVRAENQRRTTQKEPYQAQSDAFRGRYQRGRNLTNKEVKRLQSQTENVMSGAVIAPSHILGAVGRKIADPSRDLSELYWTGYDDKGVNSGYVTDEFARNHPEWATVANLAADVALGSALGRFSGGEPGTRTAVDAYDYAGPRLQIGAGKQPAGYLGTRNLPAVRYGTDMVPIDAPLMIEGRKLPTIYRGNDVGPAWTPRSAQQQLSFSPNVTIRGTSEVGFPRQQGFARGRGPIDLDYVGTTYEGTPGTPLRFQPRFPWWAWPDYYEGSSDTSIHKDLDEVVVTGTPPASPSQPSSGGNGGGGKGRGRGSRHTSGTASSPYEDPRIPNNLGPAVEDAILVPNRAPDYGPAANAMARGRKWNPVVDMDGNTIIPGWNIVNGEAVRAKNPGVTDLSYQYVPKDDPETVDRILNEYGFGGVFFI